MANQPEQPNYDVGVYQIETTDPVDGGVGSITNSPLLNLADRTAYLKLHVDNLESGATQPPGMAPLNSPDFTGSPTAPTAPGGDISSKIANTVWTQGLVNGVSTINCAGNANVILTAAQAGVGVLELTGILTGNISVVVPNAPGKWQIANMTTGAFTLTVKTATGSGVVVAQGKHTQLYCDSANVGDSKTDFPSPALTGTPTTPTAASGDNSATVASTAFVHAALLGNLTPASVAANTGTGAPAGSFATSGSQGTISVTDTGGNGANIALHGSGATTPSKFIRADNGNLDFVNSAYNAVIASLTDAGLLTTNGLNTSNATLNGTTNTGPVNVASGGLEVNGTIDIGRSFSGSVIAPAIQGTTSLLTGNNVGSTGNTLILNSVGVGQIILRPGGATNAAGQAVYSAIGNLSIAGTLSQGSDARVKTNVQKIENALDIVTKYFVGVTFDRTDSPDGEAQQCDAGFISQDVEVGVPSLIQEVVNGDIQDFKNLKYVNMLAYMANAISELNDIVQAQGAAIAALKVPAQ